MVKKFVRLDDRIVIRISGGDASAFLQGIISNDITKLENEPAIYALMLTPQGKYLHEFFVIKTSAGYLLDTPKNRSDELLKKLNMYKLRSKVDISSLQDSYTILSAQQPFEDDSVICFTDPRNPKLGFRIIIPADKLNNFISANPLEELPFAEYEKLRISLKIPEGEKDLIPDKSFPLEYGLDELNAIDFGKGCYVGQEVTARTKHRGVIRKKIYLVEAEKSLPEAGTPITTGGAELGEMRSSCGTIGLALLRIEEATSAITSDQTIISGNSRVKTIC